MFKLFDSGRCPIGIDVGTNAVRLLQFRTTGPSGDGELTLQAACRVELESVDPGVSPAARIAIAVRRALDNYNFQGKDVVFSLPVGSVNTRSVRLPQMPDSDLSQALQWEAKDRFGFECSGSGAPGSNGAGNTGELVWFRAGEVRRGTEIKDEILLFAVQGDVLGDYIQAISGMGLRVRAVDLPPCATYRSVHRTLVAGGTQNVGALGAMLDIGHMGAQFFITRGEDLVFYKHIDLGGRKIDEAVAAKLGITPAEAIQMRSRLVTDSAVPEESELLSKALRDAMRAPLEELARELDMCIRYYVVTFRGSRPESILLTGRQAGCAQVRDTLAAALSVRVDEAQPLRGVHDLGDAARPDRSGEWAVAAGLSLYPLHAQARTEAA